jgi:capsular polysaccharide biosynthesis protein
VLEETYRTYVRNTEEARLSDQIANNRLANVRVVQSAEPPATGARPRKLIMMASASFGLFAAMALFWILSAMRQTMIGVIDTERELQLPVLVSVPDRRISAQRAATTGQASLFRASPTRTGSQP